MKDFRFQYVLTMPAQKLEDASPLFGFTPGVQSIAPLIKTVLSLPQHLMQLVSDRDNCVAMRISGATYRIVPLQVEVLPLLPMDESIPFWCLLSTAETCEAVCRFVHRARHPILHISTTTHPQAVSASDVTVQHLFDLFKTVVSYLPGLLGDDLVKRLHERREPLPVWKSVPLSIARRRHFVTLPNELTLDSLGFEFQREEPLAAAGSDLPYVQAILASAEPIQQERLRISRERPIVYPPTIDVILSAPAFYQHWYKTALNPAPSVRVAQRIFKALISQEHYFLEGAKLPLEDVRSEQFSGVVRGYQNELRTFSIAVSARAAGAFVPVLRLPPSVNHVHPQLSQLGSCVRADRVKAPNREFKENKLARKIHHTLATSVPAEFLPLIDRPAQRIKLICNAPLEWLPLRGLPMMIRYETSRIPSTPGFTFFSLACMSYERGYPVSAFDEVLIVRSFNPNDPAAPMLGDALAKTAPQFRTGFRYNLVDVSNVDEFISAVNNFTGAVMIFDGHGRPSTVSEVGAIALNGAPIDIWKYREQLRVPPIVILSACDTHPLDGSHASVANAFLMLGATTVLATLLPISALKSSLFIARLVLRISEYIPLVTNSIGHSLRWSSVVHGLQQMSYFSELVDVLQHRLESQITPEQKMSVQMEVNKAVFDMDPAWYETSKERLSREFGKSEQHIDEVLGTWGQLPDTVKYIQLGNPEQILIAQDGVAG